MLPIESRLAGELATQGWYKGLKQHVLLQFACYDVRENLKFAMAVGAESGTGRDAIFVNDA
jgi:hypothetical protein